MNSNLESAIQEAMNELDRQTALESESRASVKLPTSTSPTAVTPTTTIPTTPTSATSSSNNNKNKTNKKRKRWP